MLNPAIIQDIVEPTSALQALAQIKNEWVAYRFTQPNYDPTNAKTFDILLGIEEVFRRQLEQSQPDQTEKATA